MQLAARDTPETSRFEKFLDRAILTFRLAPPVTELSAWLVLILGALLLHPGADPDLFARLAVGKLISTTRAVPLIDPFAFSATKPMWYDHEWLSSILFHHVFGVFDEPGLFLLNLLFAGLTIAVIRSAQQCFAPEVSRGHQRLWVLLWLPILLSIWLSTIRCQVVTFLCLALLQRILIQYQQQSHWWLYLLPPLFVIWANSHGGVVFGFGLLGLYSLFRLSKIDVLPLLVAAVSLLGIATINPYGPEYVVVLVKSALMKRELIWEWAPLPLFSGVGLLWTTLLAISVSGAYLRWQRTRQLSFELLIFLIPSVIAGFTSQRLTPLAAITALIFATREFATFTNWLSAYSSRLITVISRSVALALLALLVTVSAFITRTVVFGTALKFNLNDYPVQAMSWLASQYTGGKLLTNFNEGSYALWRLPANFRIAIDGRYEEVYPEETLRVALCALSSSCGWQQGALRQLTPDFVLLRRDWPHYSAQKQLFPDYTQVYLDPKFALLSRSSDRNKANG